MLATHVETLPDSHEIFDPDREAFAAARAARTFMERHFKLHSAEGVRISRWAEVGTGPGEEGGAGRYLIQVTELTGIELEKEESWLWPEITDVAEGRHEEPRYRIEVRPVDDQDGEYGVLFVAEAAEHCGSHWFPDWDGRNTLFGHEDPEPTLMRTPEGRRVSRFLELIDKANYAQRCG